MPRRPNTHVKVYSFDEFTIKAVWNRGRPILGYDSAIWRQDPSGHIIHFDDYGNEESAYGWHIDQIKPIAIRSLEAIANLIPLYWENDVHTSGGDYRVKGQTLS